MENERGSGLGFKPGETAEVFSKNQHYIRKFPDKAASLLGDLHYNDYGLSPLKESGGSDRKSTGVCRGSEPVEGFASGDG